MKIDPSKASHWLYLAFFGVNVVIAIILRPLFRKGTVRQVVLYGHKLNGNLKAIQEHIWRSERSSIQLTFLTMDPSYHRELSAGDVSVVLAISPRCIPLLAKADAIISDHGLHILVLMQRLTGVRFFDVWHGIPFKGFDTEDFRTQHRFDETWVASPLMERLYVEKFGFQPSRVKVTGYARTDALVNRQESVEALRSRLGLAGQFANKKIILFAPTWRQDAEKRNLIPFGVEPEDFFSRLEEVCHRTDAIVLFRAHLNSPNSCPATSGRIIPVPHAEFPDTERILLLTDILVCDWSSIAFDYLLLDRPTIFLDVEAPFKKGFSLDPSYRFGAVVSNMQELVMRLEQFMTDPAFYHTQFSTRSAEIRQCVYGDYTDGRSAERCVNRLEHWLIRNESSR